MNLKRALLAVPVVAALSLSACSTGGTDNDGRETPESGQSGSAAPANNGKSYTTNGTEPQNPLIPGNTNEVGGGRIVDMLFAGLVYYTADGTVENEMAESIETEDAKTFTVKLKEGQTFSDGSPVTSSSFVDAWNMVTKESMLNINFFESIEGDLIDAKACEADQKKQFDADAEEAKKAGEDAGEFAFDETACPRDLSGLEVVDDTTFTITLKQKEADFPLRLGYSAFYPLPQSTLDDPEAGGENPIGNGPYKVGEEGWVHKEGIKLIPNESYSGGRAPQNGGVDFVFYSELDPAYNDLLAGNLDVQEELPESVLETFQDDLTDRAINVPTALNQTITIPSRLPHFDGEEGQLRRAAISHAINREEITSMIFADTRTPATEFSSPVVAGYSADIEGNEVLNFDAAKAKELWEEADKISPWDGKFEIGYNSDGPHQTWVDAVANQIKNNLGIEAVGRPYPDFKSLRDEVTNRTITSAFRTGWQGDYPSAYNFLAPLFMTGAGSNDGDYSNPDFDKLMVDAAAAGSVDESIELMGKAQSILFEDLPAIPLWYQNAAGGFSENVENVNFGWNSVPLYYEVTVKD
jgi:ABC-type oligopeptide transport system, periplasmic component